LTIGKQDRTTGQRNQRKKPIQRTTHIYDLTALKNKGGDEGDRNTASKLEAGKGGPNPSGIEMQNIQLATVRRCAFPRLPPTHLKD